MNLALILIKIHISFLLSSRTHGEEVKSVQIIEKVYVKVEHLWNKRQKRKEM